MTGSELWSSMYQASKPNITLNSYSLVRGPHTAYTQDHDTDASIIHANATYLLLTLTVSHDGSDKPRWILADNLLLPMRVYGMTTDKRQPLQGSNNIAQLKQNHSLKIKLDCSPKGQTSGKTYDNKSRA